MVGKLIFQTMIFCYSRQSKQFSNNYFFLKTSQTNAFLGLKVGLFNGLAIKTTINVTLIMGLQMAKTHSTAGAQQLLGHLKGLKEIKTKLLNVFKKDNQYLISQEISALHYRSLLDLRNLAQKTYIQIYFKIRNILNTIRDVCKIDFRC